MATRACLRCCKLVPESASFCRRCGAALEAAGTPRPFSVPPAPSRVDLPPRGGWPTLILTTALFALAAVALLFMASIPHPGVHRSPCWLSSHEPYADTQDAPAEDYEEALSGVRERLVSAKERHGAAAERLEAARQRFEAARQRFERRTVPPRAPPPAPAVPDLQDDTPDIGPAGRSEFTPRSGRGRVGGGRPRPDAPQITGLSAPRGPAGKRIGITGRGFTGVTRVLFATGNGTPRSGAARRADAWFRLRDDRHIIVAVPHLGPGACDAVVAIFTPRGAAVTVPAGGERDWPYGAAGELSGSRGFAFVARGATLTPPAGLTLFVDSGAAVHSPAGSLVFVRSGGGVYRARTSCFIVRETDAPRPRDQSVTPVLDVPALDASVIHAAFRYTGDSR